MFRKIENVIKSAPRTLEQERADWQGETQRAKFEGARAVDERRVAFGHRKAGVQ